MTAKQLQQTMTVDENRKKRYDVRSEFDPRSSKLFNVANYDVITKPIRRTFRKDDFYRITLNNSDCNLHFADRTVRLDQPALVFSSPLISYAYEGLANHQYGYWCVFDEEFIKTSERTRVLLESPIFKLGAENIFLLDDEQFKKISVLFDRMINELDSGYRFRYEEIKNYVNLIAHAAMKLIPLADMPQIGGSTRIAKLFMELLENQFPVNTFQDGQHLKKPAEFASQLNVHANYLNHAVKEVTGKTTSTHIAERTVNEAKALLKHTEWNIAEIGYSLGFSYPNHFNHFFKKQTGITPMGFRR